MNYLNIEKGLKVLFVIFFLLVFYFYSMTFFKDDVASIIINDEPFAISFDNEVVNENFISLFEDIENIQSASNKEILFKDLGVELSGIVSIKDQPDRGYIILNFLNKKVEKNIFKPGDKIDDNVFLEAIHTSYIVVSINNTAYQIYLTDKKKITAADGILTLDVSLIEILPYLKIKQGNIKSTPGIYISDRVNGKILKKLHLKETDLLFNLNGYNVFNLATLNDAYRKLQNKKEIVASIYRDGKIQKLVARRVDA